MSSTNHECTLITVHKPVLPAVQVRDIKIIQNSVALGAKSGGCFAMNRPVSEGRT